MVSADTLDAAVGTYNAYRRPMVVATVADHDSRSFAVRFAGPFCRMCCDYDYFEDLVYELAALGEDPAAIDVAAVTYEGDERFLVEFSTAA